MFNLTKTICAPSTLIDPTTAESRKSFAKEAEDDPDNVIPLSCWNVSSDSKSLTLSLSREAFLALQTHRIRIKTPLENDFIDFSRVFTRHTKNPRYILKVTSPYYKPKIRHYKDLMSLESLSSEAKFLLSVKPDPHIYESKQYYSTYTKYCNKVLKDLYKNEDLKLDTLQISEVKYLKYLSKKLKYDNNAHKQIQSKYVAAKFYGQLLDLTNFSDDNEKTNAN